MQLQNRTNSWARILAPEKKLRPLGAKKEERASHQLTDRSFFLFIKQKINNASLMRFACLIHRLIKLTSQRLDSCFRVHDYC